MEGLIDGYNHSSPFRRQNALSDNRDERIKRIPNTKYYETHLTCFLALPGINLTSTKRSVKPPKYESSIRLYKETIHKGNPLHRDKFGYECVII